MQIIERLREVALRAIQKGRTRKRMSVVDCTSISVGSAQDAVELALLLVGECHGKRTTVAWDGAVVLTIPLTIPDGSTIIIMGLGPDRSALLGGGTTFPLLAAQGADLTLQRLQVGRGVGGGVAGWGSNITAQHCEFESNGSEGDGAAIRLDQGKLDLTNCSFVDNHAVSGRSINPARLSCLVVSNSGVNKAFMPLHVFPVGPSLGVRRFDSALVHSLACGRTFVVRAGYLKRTFRTLFPTIAVLARGHTLFARGHILFLCSCFSVLRSAPLTGDEAATYNTDSSGGCYANS